MYWPSWFVLILGAKLDALNIPQILLMTQNVDYMRQFRDARQSSWNALHNKMFEDIRAPREFDPEPASDKKVRKNPEKIYRLIGNLRPKNDLNTQELPRFKKVTDRITLIKKISVTKALIHMNFKVYTIQWKKLEKFLIIFLSTKTKKYKYQIIGLRMITQLYKNFIMKKMHTTLKGNWRNVLPY